MSEHQKKVAAIVGAVVVAFLVYRHFSSSGTSSAGMPTSSDPASSDYASLAGQEQSDVANLQNQIAALGAEIAGITIPTAGPKPKKHHHKKPKPHGGSHNHHAHSGHHHAEPSRPEHNRTKRRTKAKQHKAQTERGQQVAKHRSTHVHTSPNRHIHHADHRPKRVPHGHAHPVHHQEPAPTPKPPILQWKSPVPPGGRHPWVKP